MKNDFPQPLLMEALDMPKRWMKWNRSSGRSERGGGVGRGLVGVEIKFKREKWIIKSRARMPLHFSFNWIQSIDGSFHQFTPNEWTQYWKSEQAFGSCAKIKPWTSEFVCVCVCVFVCLCEWVCASVEQLRWLTSIDVLLKLRRYSTSGVVEFEKESYSHQRRVLLDKLRNVHLGLVAQYVRCQLVHRRERERELLVTDNWWRCG